MKSKDAARPIMSGGGGGGAASGNPYGAGGFRMGSPRQPGIGRGGAINQSTMSATAGVRNLRPTMQQAQQHSGASSPMMAGSPQMSAFAANASSTDAGQSATATAATTPPQSTTPTPAAAGGGAGAVAATQSKEINTATICKIGQETVQEIMSRMQEVFSILKATNAPVGSTMQRLHVCWDKCQENTQGMDAAVQIETSLLRDRDNGGVGGGAVFKPDAKRTEAYRQALEEHTEYTMQLRTKNQHLKDIIDQMRNIIWEVNTMLAMRHA